ncbi:hypothetical protein FOCG_12068 [Fusarium oxysporum f. sp. radicis-lycopersici 26381]|jgi:hypothetical protein|nr:hypothetical protein FOWG_08987 [Fusarium oxysporum f. sp. lycopersici MN25]EXL46085.1 hypothetical protein FOCG_12068 [Fusarium oxysporum f. sp. radicis-lycopersici 26381]
MEDRMIGTYGGPVVTSGNELVDVDNVVEASGAATALHRAALMGDQSPSVGDVSKHDLSSG